MALLDLRSLAVVMFVVRVSCAPQTDMDCCVSISTSEGVCTANSAARVLLQPVILFTHPTQNGNLLFGQKAEGSATIDLPRHHPPEDVREGGHHRSIVTNTVP